MQEDIRYIKANPEFNKKLNELIQMQKGILSEEAEAEWGFEFDKDSNETGLPEEDIGRTDFSQCSKWRKPFQRGSA